MFTVRRQDKFTTKLMPGTTHCALDSGKTVTLDYDAYITVEDAGLDQQGFVVDNKIFGEFFEKQKETAYSCERMAAECAIFLRESVSIYKRSHILEVCVKIWGVPGKAYAEYRWMKN